MLIFVVARTRLDRYEELRRQFENWRDMSIILDRREGDRRTGQGTYVGVNRRGRVDRRRVDVDMSFMKLDGLLPIPASVTMSILHDLETFVLNRRQHGTMTADTTEPAWNGYLLTMACPCGVVFERWVTPEEADADLLRLARLN